MKRLLLLILVLLPLAAAQGVEEWHQHIRTESTTNGVLASDTFSFSRPHGWTNATGQSVIEVNAHYVIEGSGIQSRHVRFMLLVDSVEACNWELSTSASSTRMNPTVTLDCLVPFLAEGDHTTEITATVVAGANPVIDATTSLTLRHTETINMDITVTTAFDQWLPLTFWTLIMVWSLYQGYVFPAFAGLVVLPGFFVDPYPIGEAFGFLFMILAFWVEAIASTSLWRRWTKRSSDEI